MENPTNSASGATTAAARTAAEVPNPAANAETLGFGRIDLKGETHVVPPGLHHATIAEVRPVKNRDEDTLWLFVWLDVHDADGVVLGQVEDRFITIAARGGSPHMGRVRAGLKRLALYGAAAGADLNGCEPEEIGSHLVGKRILAVISRRGTGVQAENGVITVKAEV